MVNEYGQVIENYENLVSASASGSAETIEWLLLALSAIISIKYCLLFLNASLVIFFICSL